MKIKARTWVTEEAEIATPAYFKTSTTYSMVTETMIIEVLGGMICQWENSIYSETSFQNKALEASKGAPITKEEFDLRFAEVMASFDAIVHGQKVIPEPLNLAI